MKKIIGLNIILLLFVLTCELSATDVKLGSSGKRTVNLNNSVGKNQILFNSKAPGEEINGSANDISGSFYFDPANVEATSGKFTVQVKSMESGISKRDKHMFSAPWLDADNYTTITYNVNQLSGVSTSVDPKSGKAVIKCTSTGEFNLHGVTKPMKANVTITFLTESETTKKRASGDLFLIQAEFTVPIKEYKIFGASNLIGEKVSETVTIKANLFGNSGK